MPLSRPSPEFRRPGLLVVDVQRFFFDPRSPAFMRGCSGVLERVRALVGDFRSRGLPVLFTCYASALRGPMASRWRKACPRGSPWVQPILRPAPGEPVFYKSRYSAFRGTRALAWLRKRRVRDLVVAGVKTHLCVESTVRDAFDAGFRVIVARDGCAAPDPGMHRGSLRNMAHGFADILPTKDLVSMPEKFHNQRKDA
ncbi:MAG: isochorismatase family cysteine hydrolase [Elusimicrobiota bacterium]